MLQTTIEELQKTALLSALLVRKRDLEERLIEIENELEVFEREHSKFKVFEKSMGDSFEDHEVWIKWSFLLEAKKRLEEELRAVKAELSALGYK